ARRHRAMSGQEKPKFAMYWAASCGGCEISTLNIGDKILAVDAATGPLRALGQITVRRGPVWPGLGLGRLMLPLGDLSVTGVVRPRHPLGKLLAVPRGRPERRAAALAPVIAEGIIQGLGGGE
ncbi:MAG: DUF1256 domain-containing protein, partial [Syntrophomonadaceae bacterium]|nr:DUF1256 domain-containing protein [Syntrophomonadaceae bacterium]